jgi:hypothetical protein
LSDNSGGIWWAKWHDIPMSSEEMI